MELKNKKVLLMGLGILGGGVATARWLVEQGAILTVTDMKNEEILKPSLEKLKDLEGKARFVLGRHEEKDFLDNDIIVVNPDVPADNKFVELARKAGKQIENELTLFFSHLKSKNVVAITGTRGKTTTTNWTAHFLKMHNVDTFLVGNSPEKPFLQEIKNINENSLVVLEVPSYHLEIVNGKNFKPHVAVITNLYRDHINRHKTMEEYASAKANIFKGQNEDDFLILNKENEWTDFFFGLKPKSQVIFYDVQDNFSPEETEEFLKKWGEHNLLNLFASASAALAMGVSVEEIKTHISTLPQIKFRQEKVFENENLAIFNDTTATSPEASMAAMERFATMNENLIFIAGGTDRDLEFKKWAEVVEKNIKPEQLILLSGSATEKMKKELGWDSFNEFETLKECLNKALEIAKGQDKSNIVFSPGAKSFEKFKNEFDRGEKFNLLVKETL
ncbi:MAG: UDP-N-acetylmuramoyl-L-alanine--D-glutamate ligase [Patescibacteria group bacterium]